MSIINKISIDSFKLDLDKLDPEIREQVIQLSNNLQINPPKLQLSTEDLTEIVEYALKNEN